MSHTSTDQLLSRRSEILEELSSIYPLHRGSVYEYKRKCGKSTCRCARDAGQGHPLRLLTWKEGTRSRALQLKTQESFEVAEQHVNAYRRHQELVDELLKIGEHLSEMGILAGKSEVTKKKRTRSPSKKTARSRTS